MERSKTKPSLERVQSKDSFATKSDFDDLPVSEWEEANSFMKWTFSVVNPLLKKGLEAPLQYEQLYNIPRGDYCGHVMRRLKLNYYRSQSFMFFPRLLVALVRTRGGYVTIALILTLLEGVFRVVSPLLLRFLLLSIQNGAPVGESYMFALILSFVGFLQVIVHHILFFYTMRIGWNWKNATTALIHDRLVHLDSAALQGGNAGTGMMVNLISNDVQRFEEVTIFGLMTFTALLEALAVLIILIFILDVSSAFAGVGFSFLLLPVTMFFAKKVAQFRGQTASSTDQRVRHISEIITGIASVKSYAWETPFFHMIRKLRAIEVGSISNAQMLRAISLGFSFFTPSLVALITFTVFWAAGGRLTIAKVFTTLSLLHVLRFALGRAFTRGVETLSECVASCRRIEHFLSLQPCNPNINYVTGGSPNKQKSTQSVKFDGIYEREHSSDFFHEEDHKTIAQLRSASSMLATRKLLTSTELAKDEFMVSVSEDPTGDANVEGGLPTPSRPNMFDGCNVGISSEDWADGDDFDEDEIYDQLLPLPSDSHDSRASFPEIESSPYPTPDQSPKLERSDSNRIDSDNGIPVESPSVSPEAEKKNIVPNASSDSNIHQMMASGSGSQKALGSKMDQSPVAVKCEHPDCKRSFPVGEGGGACENCALVVCNEHRHMNVTLAKKSCDSLCSLCYRNEVNATSSKKLLNKLMGKGSFIDLPDEENFASKDDEEEEEEEDGDDDDDDAVIEKPIQNVAEVEVQNKKDEEEDDEEEEEEEEEEEDDEEEDEDCDEMDDGDNDMIKKLMAKMGSRSSKRKAPVSYSPNCQHPNCETRFSMNGDGRHNCSICGQSFCNTHVYLNYMIRNKHFNALCMICKKEEQDKSGSQQLLLDLLSKSGSFNVSNKSLEISTRSFNHTSFRNDPNVIVEGSDEEEHDGEDEEESKAPAPSEQTKKMKQKKDQSQDDDYDDVHNVHSESNYRDMGLDGDAAVERKDEVVPELLDSAVEVNESPDIIVTSAKYSNSIKAGEPINKSEKNPPALTFDVHDNSGDGETEEFGVSLKEEEFTPARPHVPVISLTRSSYYYGTDPTKPVLSDISFSVNSGELLIVVGPVGSGKSSLLLAMLGEIPAVQPVAPSLVAQGSGSMKNSSKSEDRDSSKRPHLIKQSSSRDFSSFCYMQYNSKVAYCAQRPWVLAASVRSNIVLAGETSSHMAKGDFKNPEDVDLDLYSRAVESTLMVDDFLQWPAYDDTEVGERGISVSGGQKARISLARAVYADADLYVLDDPLSAVDAHVGKALMVNCICKTLRDEQKAVVLVTHQLQYLEYADKILVLDKDGRQTFYGSYAELNDDEAAMQSLDLCGKFQDEDEEEEPDFSVHRADTVPVQGIYRESSLAVAAWKRPAPILKVTSINSVTSNNSAVKKSATYDPMYRLELRRKLNQSVVVASNSDLSSEAKAVSKNDGDIEAGQNDLVETEREKQRRKIVQSEDRVKGTISFSVYWRYLTGAGSGLGIFALILIFISQGALMISEYWLRWWATDSLGSRGDSFYLGVFAGLVLGVILLGILRAYCWFRFTLQSASELHERCLWAVLHSPLKFFVSNPTGRILNRFAKDQGLTDEMLPITFFLFLETFVYCAAALVLVCIFIPYLAILLPILGYLFINIRQKYVTSSREIKRMEALTRSPIYADFSATLDGLITIRAYKMERRVTDMFQKQINDNARAYFSFLLAARWIGFRLDMETAVILMFVCILAVVLRDQIEVGLLGFTLVYTLALSGLFQWMVRQSAEVETQMTSVERIYTYTHLLPEEGYQNTSLDKALREERRSRRGSIAYSSRRSSSSDAADYGYQGIPPAENLINESVGHVQLNDLTVTYRPDLDPVLQNITVDIPPGCKVGVCGRTGSGKSSTLLALLRLNIITSGDILLDGESLLKMDLQVARSLVSIIPQDPHLFSGTVRFNLDPFHSHTDEEIWSALGDAHIHDFIRSNDLGLSMQVEEGGENFSVGQRQLLSLARAILRRAKVVLMDEVTASIDFMTDRQIQETIRTSPALRDATIITVAHRLRTIADSNLIVVVHNGHIVERGSPQSLLQQENSHFRTLAEESNEFEEIFRIASGDQNNHPENNEDNNAVTF